MSMSRLVAALGAAAGGVSKGMDEAEAAADRKRKRQQEEEDRAFTMSERARALKLREDMGAASAPVPVEQVEQPGPVMPGAEGAAGQPIPAVTMAQRRSFASPEEANAAVNSPQAVADRQYPGSAPPAGPIHSSIFRNLLTCVLSYFHPHSLLATSPVSGGPWPGPG